MRTPEFWRGRSVLSDALGPFAVLYAWVSRWRQSRIRPERAPVPVICVGNLVAGGAGKTPVTLALAARLQRRGVAVHLLTRGYRGRLKGPVRVDLAVHDFRDVGDEALLLARAAPTWVARDRAAGARAAAASGAALVLMDDGLQHPGLAKDLSLVVVDGGFGFGNFRLLPAGPLREPVEVGLAKVQLAVLIGEDKSGSGEFLRTRLPIAHARLIPRDPPDTWRGRKVLAFAGIGRPMKFFETLEGLGAVITARFAFPDHYPYEDGDLVTLLARAADSASVPVTTEKDWVRLPSDFRTLVVAVPVEIAWDGDEDEARIDAWLDRIGLAG